VNIVGLLGDYLLIRALWDNFYPEYKSVLDKCQLLVRDIRDNPNLNKADSVMQTNVMDARHESSVYLFMSPRDV
jgi:hypothetical protein